MSEEDYRWCARCQEDFPVASKEERKQRIRMGLLYPLRQFSKKFREHYEVKAGTGKYLCGNCYYDLLSDFEDGD